MELNSLPAPDHWQGPVWQSCFPALSNCHSWSLPTSSSSPGIYFPFFSSPGPSLLFTSPCTEQGKDQQQARPTSDTRTHRAGEGDRRPESPAAMDRAGEGDGQTERPAATDGAGEGDGRTERSAATDRAGEGDGRTERPAAMETPPPPEIEQCQAEGQGPPGPTSLAGIGLDEAICYICKDYLTNPVTIECGHNFCRGCITQRCVGHSCPRCGAMFQKRDFKSNTLLGRILESIKQPGLNPGQSRREGNVCEEHGKELTWFCKEDRKHICEDCQGSPAHCSHAVIPMAKASHESKGQASTSSRSENASVQEQEATSTRPPEPKESSRAIGRHVRVTLDEDTAHPALILTEDWRGVRFADTRQDLYDNPERFDKRSWVLGCQGFTEGTVYWEVEVGDEVFWVVGVAKESVRKKGWINQSPEEGIWAIDWNTRMPRVPPSSQSTPPQNSKWIRVCLNYEQGQVTFFNADNEALIHTVTGASFDGERIRPFFGTKSQLSLRPCPEMEGWAGDTHQ